jgi:hypothetical protein
VVTGKTGLLLRDRDVPEANNFTVLAGFAPTRE